MADTPNARSISEMAWTTPSDATDPQESPTVLTVALSEDVLAHLPRHVLDPQAVVARATFDKLTRSQIVGPNAPDLILSPLVQRGFDAMDLLTMLSVAGFRGRYLVLAPAAPHVTLIRSEMQNQAPELNVDIIVLDGTSVLHEI